MLKEGKEERVGACFVPHGRESLRTSRRRILGCIAGVAGAALLPLPASSRHRPAEGFLALLGNREAAARVGLAYLAQVPEEADRDVLLVRLALPPGQDPASVVTARKREDFRCGRVVRLENWVLSSTEARLCALVALS